MKEDTSCYYECACMDRERLRSIIRSHGTGKQAVTLFRHIIYRYFKEHGRDLPWRNFRTPYHVLVSEVMLQQTQVSRVIEKYQQFVDVFPDAASLAAAPLRDVLSVWQGLGYNRRARALKKSAELVISRHGGVVPCSVEDLAALPGIGPATASSIAAFAFNAAVVFVETNIRSVILFFFFEDREDVRDSEIRPLVKRTLDGENPGSWYNALMDYGSMLKSCGTNPGRRSAHHTHQSPFRGSNRQIRGMILKTLVAESGLNIPDLVDRLGKDPEAVRRNLSALGEEGFIRCVGGRYEIA